MTLVCSSSTKPVRFSALESEKERREREREREKEVSDQILTPPIASNLICSIFFSGPCIPGTAADLTPAIPWLPINPWSAIGASMNKICLLLERPMIAIVP
jgi:hypothetical protein